MNLTTEEENELKARPIGTSCLTDEQILLRQEIGKKMCDYFLQVDTSLTPEIREIYEKTPMWKILYGRECYEKNVWSLHL